MNDTQLIKDKIDIVDLIQEYVQLKPAGINHKGLCPFHQEKSPSFMVSRDRQNFKCFGCGKGGDIFTFMEEMEGMEFVEALKHLAARAGVQLTQTVSDVNSSQKNRLKDIHAEAARFYYNFLTKMDVSQAARSYLQGRGVAQETMDLWQIGFVPDQWDLLTKYLLKKGFGIDDLVAAGLTITRDGANKATGRGFYDRFRGRIMFPIRDTHAAVVGFTGRVLLETEKSGGKYVNTPQTMLYDKSRILFGLHEAKQQIKTEDLAVVVEGQMDVIASHQAGIRNVVASSGTALTEHQIKLLKRYTTNVAMAFDMDDAGVKAAKRGIELAVAEGLNVRVIQIPDGAGKDPDECIQNDPAIWKQSIAQATDVMEWYFARAFAGKEVQDPKVRQSIANELLVEIARIPFAVEKDHWLTLLAGRLGVDVSVLREDLSRIQDASKKKQSVDKPTQHTSVKNEAPPSRLDLLLERFFSLGLLFPDVFYTPLFAIPELVVSTTRFAALYKVLQEEYTNARSIDISKLADSLPAESKDLPDVLTLRGSHEFSTIEKKAAVATLQTLQEQILHTWQRERRSAIQHELAQAEAAGNTEKVTKLMQEFQLINKM